MAKTTRGKPWANGTAHSFDKSPAELADEPAPTWQLVHGKDLSPAQLANLALGHEYLQKLGIPVDDERLDRMVGLTEAPVARVSTGSKLSKQVTVYYIRVGPYIKIGQTGNLKQRLSAYPPETVVLATETGPRDVLESSRHQQFKADCIGQWRREWFFPSAALIAHINDLREQPLSAAELAG